MEYLKKLVQRINTEKIRQELKEVGAIAMNGLIGAVLTFVLAKYILGMDDMQTTILTCTSIAFIMADTNCRINLDHAEEKFREKMKEKAEQAYTDACGEVGRLRTELEKQKLL